MTRALMFLIALSILVATQALAEDRQIILQSTTSTANSGLLDAILPKFKEETGIDVHVVAVGTGQALKNARNGDGDVLLVHARTREETFIAEGYGVERFDVMYNDFIVVGPSADPAGIKGLYDVATALESIAAAQAVFVSRGDESGTHIKEKSLWNAANVDIGAASGSWYRETGSGMGATLNIAAGMNAYALTDRATWIAFANKADLTLLVEGDKRLYNQYGVILVNPQKHAHVRADDGQAFIDWLRAPEGQFAIADFKKDGQQLLFPNAEPAQ